LSIFGGRAWETSESSKTAVKLWKSFEVSAEIWESYEEFSSNPEILGIIRVSIGKKISNFLYGVPKFEKKEKPHPTRI